MCRNVLFLLLFLLGIVTPVVPAKAAIQSKVHNTITAEAPILDVAGSFDGIWTYVLTEGGKIYVYSSEGQLNDIIQADPATDRIQVAGQNGERLYAASRAKKTVQLIELTFSAKIDVSGSPFLGSAKAPITVVVFSDFQCPHCAKMGSVFEEILAKNPDKVKVVFKHSPLKMHPYAAMAALAAIAADNQGKFWQFHDELFKNQNELNNEKVMEIAKRTGLDMLRFSKDVGSTEGKDKLAKDVKDGSLAGVRGTPTVYVNGTEVAQLTAPEIQKQIDVELEILNRAGTQKK